MLKLLIDPLLGNNRTSDTVNFYKEDGKLVSVIERDNYLYTKDRYGNLKPLTDDLGRHVRKSLL